MNKRICPFCKKKLSKYDRPNKRFCCENHRLLFHAREQYQKYKDDKIYKKNRYLRLKKWRIKNRKRFNQLCLEATKRMNLKKR